MKKPSKAALLSALVFPGIGHFFLKRYISGTIIAGIASMALYVSISNLLERAQEIVDQVQRGEIQPDIESITESLSAQPAGSETQLITISAIVWGIFWLIGIVDAYRIGRSHESESVAGN